MSSNRRYRIDLIRQMADCDANFIRLLKLMPELESFRNAHLQNPSSGAGFAREFLINSPGTNEDDVKVRISVLEVFRYTSTLAVTQLTKINHWIEPPGMMVRVYHDAATAEAVSYQGHRAFLAKYAVPNPTMYHQDEKRQINEFLGEWLSLCLQTGRSRNVLKFICTA